MGDRLAEEAEITERAMALLGQILCIDSLGGQTAEEESNEESSGSKIAYRLDTGTDQWSRLLAKESAAELQTQATGPTDVLFPGSFNPLHRGHLAMAEHASNILSKPVAFEICVDNVDKPALSFYDLAERSGQFTDQPLWLTRLPTFIEKARQFPGAVFIVGIDTLVRIGMARYYKSETAMHEAFAEFARLGNRFLVFGRVTGGEFVTLSNSTIPTSLRKLCDGVSEEQFRIDLSSSELRNA